MKTTSLTPVVSVFIFFIALLLVWATIGAIGFYSAVVSYGWPTTVGTVISAEVKSPTGKATKYIAEISYTYVVEGKDYTSNSYMATSARGTSQWAKELIGQHPAGSTVTVHYDPKKPEHSVVEPGLQSDNYIMTFAPLGFVIILIYGLRKQIHDRKKLVENITTDGR